MIGRGGGEREGAEAGRRDGGAKECRMERSRRETKTDLAGTSKWKRRHPAGLPNLENPIIVIKFRSRLFLSPLDKILKRN
jgi:hypothetical protein